MGRKKKACTNCEFLTPYQMLNNRDERVDVHHCSMLGTNIKAIKGNYIEDVEVTIMDPETFSCGLHKIKPKPKQTIIQ